MGEALAVCAEAIATCISPHARGDANIHVLETVYFTVIFILRSIPKLADLASTTENSHIYMILQTLAYWVSTIVYRSLYALHECVEFNEDKVRAKMSFRSLAYLRMSVRDFCYSNNINSSRKYRYDNPTLVSRSLSNLLRDQTHEAVNIRVFPPEYQSAASLANNSPVVQELIKSAEKSTRRLIRSID